MVQLALVFGRGPCELAGPVRKARTWIETRGGLMRKTATYAAVIAALTVATLITQPLVAARATSLPKATGDVALASPLQYASFNAFDGGATDSGSINYTNFTYADPGTNVWN